MTICSKELCNTRREEIIDACEKLYDTRSFREVSIKEIGNATSFTRTSIYNYFQTKEEIFLAFLKREYLNWIDDINEIASQEGNLPRDKFAELLAETIAKHPKMLRLLSMNIYEIEENSSLERLTEFKSTYREFIEAIKKCLDKVRPEMNEDEKEKFIALFLPFVQGIFPYTFPTEKQIKAMEISGCTFKRYSIKELASMGIKKIMEV